MSRLFEFSSHGVHLLIYFSRQKLNYVKKTTVAILPKKNKYVNVGYSAIF